MLRFAVVGIDHGHVFEHVHGLLAAGAECAGFDSQSSVPALVEQFSQLFPDVPERSRAELMDDPSIEAICTAAIPSDRAGIAIEAMRHGKDAMVDKPGVTSWEQLEAVKSAIAESGRTFSVCFSERFCVPSAVKAGKLIEEGVLGKVIQTIGMGPHRLGEGRPDWFWDPARYGGIIVDIASHQIDQFLYYTGAETADVAASTVGNFANADHAEFQDFGEVLLHSAHSSGYIRVDWFTPDGLPTWGDGRLTVLGTNGYIELRKYVDIAGRPGGDHLFLVTDEGVQHIDCSDEPLIYFKAFVHDVKHRTHTAVSQEHVLEVCRLSLDAQDKAVHLQASGIQMGGR